MKARPAKAPLIPAHPGVTVLEDEVVWDGRFPLQRVRFTYTRFDGSRSGELVWELWRRHAGVAVLPYDPVADSVALIEQFRLPALAAGLDPIMVECPAGLREIGEAPERENRQAAPRIISTACRRAAAIGRAATSASGILGPWTGWEAEGRVGAA